jgi:hypothetical protein
LRARDPVRCALCALSIDFAKLFVNLPVVSVEENCLCEVFCGALRGGDAAGRIGYDAA